MSVIWVPFQIVKVATGTKVVPGTPVIPWDKLDPKNKDAPIQKLERFRRWDSRPPADPAPPKKPPPKPDKPPKPNQPAPWKTNPDCQIERDDIGSEGLKQRACIAENVAQAMTDCYNRGFAAAKKAYNSRWSTVNPCQQANEDARWMNQRLKRILLSQEKPQVHKRTVISRNK